MKKLQEKSTLKILDVGCCRNKIPGAIGVDIDPDSDVDIICDFTKILPVADNEFDREKFVNQERKLK